MGEYGELRVFLKNANTLLINISSVVDGNEIVEDISENPHIFYSGIDAYGNNFILNIGDISAISVVERIIDDKSLQ